MELSTDLIKQFVDVTNDSKASKESKTTHRATAVVNNKGIFVKIDGSDILTPVSMATDARDGDRVLVTIENHHADIIGNITSPGSGRGASDLYSKEVQEDGTIVVKGELRAAKEYVDELIAGDVTAEMLVADNARIGKLEADKADISDLEAANAKITKLETDKADISDLEAANAKITKLETDKLSAESADLKYANIDFSNIGEAAVEKLFTESGIIKDIIVSEGKITGELVGVTIKGDLIEANTLKADKLVVLGEDGLYYKLNVDALGETTASSDPKYQNGLDGSVIITESITAEKIAVDDLVAFDATIGGFNIGTNSIYSGVKDSINNTTRGIYLDTEGQLYFGDDTNYIRYYKAADGKYKLAVSAETITFGTSGKGIEEAFEELRDEITTLLRIESSRGTVFKNDQVSTVLSAVIYHGTQRITDYETMKSVFGSGAYLQWKWQRLDEESYGIISASDTRFSDNGFKFTLNPEDVDTKVTFMCELIV